MAADAPEDSPPSQSSSSPPPNSSSNNSTSPPSPSPPNSSSPPPESPPSTPEKSPPPPKEESPSPSPTTTPSPPPPSPPPPSAAPPPPSPPPSSPPPPSPSKGSNQTHVPATHHTPPPPKLRPQIAPPTVPPPPPKHSPPPPKSHSSDSNSNTDDGSISNNISPQLPLILGLTAGVVLLLVIAISLVIVVFCRKKKETMHRNNHMQYFSNYTSPQGNGGDGNASGLSPAGHEANNVPPYGGAASHGGWQQPQSPQLQTPSTQGRMSYSSEMSSNAAVQPIPPTAHASPSPLGLNQSSFSYEELSMATFGFSQGQMLGQGGFGHVHKGVLANGKEVAVKSLKSGSGQGEREFQAEVETISRVHHRHLVSLVGYCVAGERRMLVYEFLPNKTLEYHLHEKGPMDWPTRLKIALGAAKGLAYLHEDCHPRIIHRDIKSANILLDYTFEAKVADFGLAKLTQDTISHVSTRVMGTFGYLAPEYASSGKLTEKSDVFSFGVVLLELITGRRPLDLNLNMDESLVDWARPLCESAMETGNFRELVDPRLENNFVHLEMARMVACAGASIRHSARRRPKMRQIVRALEDDVPLDEVKGVVAATQSSRFSPTNDTAESECDSSSYSADMRRFKKMVMDSQDYSSSDFGNTDEYGHNPSSSSSGSSGPIAPTQS